VSTMPAAHPAGGGRCRTLAAPWLCCAMAADRPAAAAAGTAFGGGAAIAPVMVKRAPCASRPGSRSQRPVDPTGFSVRRLVGDLRASGRPTDAGTQQRPLAFLSRRFCRCWTEPLIASVAPPLAPT